MSPDRRRARRLLRRAAQRDAAWRRQYLRSAFVREFDPTGAGWRMYRLLAVKGGAFAFPPPRRWFSLDLQPLGVERDPQARAAQHHLARIAAEVGLPKAMSTALEGDAYVTRYRWEVGLLVTLEDIRNLRHQRLLRKEDHP